MYPRLALGLVLAVLLASHCRAGTEKQLASTGADPIELWKQNAASAAKVVEEALRQQDPKAAVELKGVDWESLRILQGQRLELALEVDNTVYKFFTESEPQWHSLTDALPGAGLQGAAVVPKTDWDALERHWVAPVSQGPLLPDFTLEGPLDLYLKQPTTLQLYLPHPVDVGRLQRVLLREGASVTVRGAHRVGLRRPVDLPSLSLGDFASLITSDSQMHPAAGILHLLEGVRAAARQQWNVTHPDLSLAVVSLELDFPPNSGALLSAPSPVGGRGLQRLKPRKLKEGVVELAPREALSEEESKALALAPGAPYAWPLRGVHPQHLQAYERLLREVLGSQVFSVAGGGKKGGGSSGGVRLQQDLQLRLQKTQSEAMTLLQMQVEVERWPKSSAEKEKAGSAGGAAGEQQPKGGEAEGQQDAAGTAEAAAAAGAKGEGGGKEVMERPPDALAVLLQPKAGPHEVWNAVLQVKQDPETGALRFVPVRVDRLDASQHTVSFSQGAVEGFVGNFSASAAEHEEL